MSNKNEPAYPTGDTIRRDANGNLYGAPVSSVGLTKRELIAAMAMQGVIAEGDIRPDDAAQYAVKCADALLEALK